jgi:hypothetical protein
MTSQYKIGDIVRHTSKFLRSIGWYTDVPKNGKVISLSLESCFKDWPYVQWCDDPENTYGTLINPCNIEKM